MAVVKPPEITPAPTPAPQRGERATFRDRVDDFITWLIAAVAMFNALAWNMYDNAVEAFQSALAAAGSARESAESAGEAEGSAGQAAESARAAYGSASEAAASALTASTLINALTASSTTALTISLGAKTLETQPDKQFKPGVDVKLVDANNAANAMYCTVASYVGTSLQVNVTSVTGAGTIATWNISVSGQRGRDGLTGGVNGGTLQDALWAKKGADVIAATAPAAAEVWTTGGESCILTGTATITGLAAAPQAGAEVRVLVAGTPTITASANLVVKGVASGQSYTLAPGDELDIWAETTTKFRVTIRKGDGTPTVYSLGALHNLRVFNATSTFTAPKTGWYKITLAGSAGSPGLATVGHNDVTNGAGASGSGAAGFCSGMRYLIAGQTYLITVATGTPQQSLSGAAAAAQNGVAGNASSFSGTGIVTMTANGGGGGLATKVPGTIAGGIGGTASGGDLNVKGGDGGSVTVKVANAVASGGGAVGIRGQTYNGGDASSASAGYVTVASGGAGVGGKGGSAVSTTVTTFAAGGGCAGPAADSTDSYALQSHAGINYVGVAGAPASGGNVALALTLPLGGGKYPGIASASNMEGGGGAGGLPTSTQTMAGLFAGSGAVVNAGGSGAAATAGGAHGGGVGGVAVVATNSSNPGPFVVQAPAGQPGTVWIEWW